MLFFISEKTKTRQRLEKKYVLYTEKILLTIPHVVNGSNNFMKKILMYNDFDEINEN